MSVGSYKSKKIQKNIYFCFIDYAKGFDCVDHKNQWKILEKMRVPDHLNCLVRNLYAGQETIVKTRHGMMLQNWAKSKTRLYTVTLFI